MANPQVEVSRVIDAAPEVVYRILADYRVAHPLILPKPYFESVEAGGIGAGTVVRVTMRVWGAERTLRLQVSEPEPGRVLVEEDAAAGVTTTLTVTPVNDGAASRVSIATDWRSKPGLGGWLEGKINPRVARKIYRQELDQLAAYLQQTPPEP